ncbi:MAG: leucine-rich repeat protein [Muribaculaceae bacterium]|nr:leucine-rich repeat protein [Muribaculaceae bacterium]
MNTIKGWLTAVGLTAALAPTVMAGELTVNEGSTTNGYIPFHFYYLDDTRCKSQIIYPAEQLQAMKGQAINKLHFYINDDGYASSWKTDDMRLSIAEIELAAFTGDEGGYTNFLEPDWTVCYSGPKEGEGGGRDLVFELTTPYNYTGSNLLIQVSLGSAGNAYPRTMFLGVTTDNMQAAYTTTGTVYGDKFLPQTTFNFGELEPFEAKVSAESIAFPVTLTTEQAIASVKVNNSGANTFPISVTAPSDAAFTIGSLPSELASGESANIQISFKPETAGEFSSEAVINCGEAGSFTITLTGKGIDAPAGYSASFNLPAKTLPENWTGWEVTKEYDFSVYDYVNIVKEEESTDNFLSYEKDGKGGVTVVEGNHIRDYPNMTYVYMISPEIEGNFMLTATATSSNPDLLIYPATKNADGTWKISDEKIELQWLSDYQSGWGVALGSVTGSAYIAIDAVNMAMGSFNADALADAAEDAFLPSLSAENIEFGEVTVGESSHKTISLTNKGTQPFTATYTATAPFSVSGDAVSVDAGVTTDINVTFSPNETGEFTGTLTINFDEGEALSVALTGTAIAKVVELPIGTEFTVGNLEYVVTAAGEVNVSGVASGVEECIVPATVTHADGEVFDVVGIARDAFYWSSVRKVTLPEGLHTIAYGAFRQSDLAEINLPSTLKEIGDYAFRTTSLTSIEIPEGVTDLGSSVFGMCEKLSDIKLPSTLKSLGSGVFYKAAITSIIVPEQCTDIAEEAFEACASLTDITLPSALTEIKPMTFIDCSSLTSINLPASLTKIGAQAFVNTGLTSLNIPAGLSSIASNSFTNSPIALITVDPANTAFKTVDGVLYSSDGNFLYLYPRNEAESYTVVDGTRGIIGGAFYKTATKTVTLPESIVGIDEMAFCNSALEYITIPENVSLIYPQAFAGTQLKELTLPSAITKVEEALVASCDKLTTVTLPAALTDVGNRAFYNCTALTTIICQGETPSEFDGWEGLTDPFRGVDKTKVTIYCPDSAIADYKASEWGDFFENIKGISEMGSGIDNVISDNANQAADSMYIYDLTGKLLLTCSARISHNDLNLAPGIYIIRTATATTKVYIR